MKKHLGHAFNPASHSQCIFNNWDSCRHNGLRRNAISWDHVWSHVMRFHEIAAIACDLTGSQTLCLQLSEFLKIHWEREAGMKVCPKCFFMTIERIYYDYYTWAFLKKKKWENWLNIFISKTCFFLLEKPCVWKGLAFRRILAWHYGFPRCPAQ